MELAPMARAENLEPANSLEEVLYHVRRISRDFRDHPGVALSDTHVEDDGAWRYNGEAGRFTRHALGQLCAKLELPGGGTPPASYLARCPEPLMATHLNHWLHDPKRDGREVFVRTDRWEPDAPRVRAVLSNRYAVVDHLPLLEMLHAAIPKHGMKVTAWSLDDEQFTLRLMALGDHPVSLDDPLRVGLHIANSEVGLGRISISALITRLVCSNGMIVKAADLGGIRRRHVGRANESLDEIVRAGLGKVLEQADTACRRFVQLRHLPAPQPLDEFLTHTASQAELPDEVLTAAKGYVTGDTLYDVVNAFTRAAQAFPVRERVVIETAMSRFVAGGQDWR